MKKKNNYQAKIIYTSFIYLSAFIEAAKKNGEKLSEDVRQLFTKLPRIIKMYKNESFLAELLEDLRDITKDFPEKKLNLLLASVTILIEYYEQTKGKKRIFSPIDINKASRLQIELVDGNDKYVDETFDYCRIVVSELLKREEEHKE